MTNFKLCVAISGSGTLLQRMITKGLDISLVVADRHCEGLAFAETAFIPAIVLNRAEFGWTPEHGWDDDPMHQIISPERTAFTLALAGALVQHDITLFAMAGFDVILPEQFFQTMHGRLITNSHPALLPTFKGPGHAVVDAALAAGVKYTGTTIHVANLDLDSGPIIDQGVVRVDPHDTRDTLWEKIKEVERPLYADILRRIMLGNLEVPPEWLAA